MLNLAQGQTLSTRFTLITSLGQGGMGEVWLAQDNELKDQVALKILRPEYSSSPGMVELLRNECRNARRLNHPNIVRVFDFHALEPYYFISMEYVEGIDFRQFIGSDYRDFLPQLIPVLNALDYAHNVGIIHRDIKASNILCDTAGIVRLMDFGIAAAVQQDIEALNLAASGSLYSMSPQQLAHQSPQPADDIYALGSLLYQLLSGYPPFYPAITRDKIIHHPPPPMTTARPAPPQLKSVVFKLLAKAPAERPATVAEVKQALEAIIKIPVNATISPQAPATGEPPPGQSQPITPLTFQPPTSAKQSRPATFISRNTVPARLAWAALTLLLAVAVGVVYYLPRNVHPPQAEKTAAKLAIPPAPDPSRPLAAAATASPAKGLTPWAQAQLAQDRDAAEQVLRDLLGKQSMLEGKGVIAWGAQALETAKAKAAAGDEAFRQNDFKTATRAYSEGVQRLDQLLLNAPAVFNAALTKGWEAFDAGASEAAIASFQLALMIEPNHEAARQGLARAEALDQVLALMESGRQHEQNNDLPRAQADFQQANALDPEFEPARAALSQVNNRLRDLNFNQTMSEGFAALNRQDLNAARRAFERARKQKPSSQEPLDGLAQVDLKLRLKQIANHQTMATSLAQQERWGEAAKHYLAALKLDPTLVFAQRGKSHSLERAAISKELNFHIEHPQRLTSKAVLDRALALHHEVLAIENKGPKLQQQIARLSRLIDQAQTPVPIRLESDNLTHVVIYKVGKLGIFTSRELELRPGTYTAVGSRTGYRDVRLQFTIVAGKKPASVVIRCEQKI